MRPTLGIIFALLLATFSFVPTQAAPNPGACAELQARRGPFARYFSNLLNCDATLRATPTPFPTATATATPQTVPLTATPQPTRPRATATPRAPKALTQLVRDQIVTALYADASGTLYYAVAENPEYLAETLNGGYALWKKSPNSEPKQITPSSHNLIGGITVHNGMIYFNEAGALRRMPDDDNVHEGEVVIRFTNLSPIYAHVNHSLAQASVNGQDALLIAVGSVRDSAFPASGAAQDIFPPYYEEFPTGRILYATFSWLENAHEYQATRGVAGQFDELARGFRNPWGMAVGAVNGKTHILAADNDPAFIPEKNDAQKQNAGDELNDIFLATNYGHPYTYGGQEPAIGAQAPLVTFPDGSVPSGVAIANGKVFVSLQNAGMIAQVDLARKTWKPVLTNIQPYNLFGIGNLLYVADFGGIRVIDARGL